MERLVEFPGIREAPGHITAGLRSIDSAAELLYWGPRLAEVDVSPGRTIPIVVPVWLLGTVRPNGMRRRAGAHLLETQQQLGPRGDRDTWRYAKLLYQDFAPVAFYPFREANQGIVEDFRRRNWLLRNQFEAEQERAMLEAEGIPALELRQQTMIDKAQAEGPSIWRFAYKGQRSFAVN